METTKKRVSGPELLKIIAMALIVLFHVTQTLYTKSPRFEASYVVNLDLATNNLSRLVLRAFSFAGTLGNNIFFICSAWFLLNSKKMRAQKVVFLICNVWVLNFIFLSLFLIFDHSQVSLLDIVQCLFPTTFGLNWYVTCYILFYLIHPYLNIIINKMSEKQLLSFDIALLVLYFGINYVIHNLFFGSELIYFICIYFVVAYFKKFLPSLCKNFRFNLFLLCSSILAQLGLMLITNWLGFVLPVLAKHNLYWNNRWSPFILITGISLFNLFNYKRFSNHGINDFAKLTLLIYVIHENYLVRNILRPKIWIYIYQIFTYNHLILADLMFAIILFLSSALIASVYTRTIQHIVSRCSFHIYSTLGPICSRSISHIIGISR